MSFSDQIKQEYFDWLYDFVCSSNRNRPELSYRRLFAFLHSIEFIYILEDDANRYDDGLQLRRRFVSEKLGYSTDDRDSYRYILDILRGPCSVLEMLIALSLRCEEQIMDDPRYGNRIKQWFWSMIKTIGIQTETDDMFDDRFVEDKILIFLNREYEPNGFGGLFYIPDTDEDMRELSIWAQLNRYLDNF